MILQYQKSQTDPFFRFRDIQLYMTEPPTSSVLETVAVESTVIYLVYVVKTTDCTKWKQMLVIKSSNLEQKVGYLFHPVYAIDF